MVRVELIFFHQLIPILSEGDLTKVKVHFVVYVIVGICIIFPSAGARASVY